MATSWVTLRTISEMEIPDEITLRGRTVEFEEYDDDDVGDYYSYKVRESATEWYEIRVYKDAVSDDAACVYITASAGWKIITDNCVQPWEVPSVVKAFAEELNEIEVE